MKKAVLVVLVSVTVVAAILGMTGLSARAESSETDNSAVMAKLEEILSGQESIKGDLAAIKEELNIIKIRITQSQ